MHFYCLVLCQAAVATSHVHVHVAVLFFISIRRKLSFPEYSRSHSTEAAPNDLCPIPKPVGIVYSSQRGRGGFLDCMWVVQTHSGPPTGAGQKAPD